MELQQPTANQKRIGKAKEWMKLFSVTGSVQTIVMAVSFVSGLLVVNLLPKDQYALYTMANTILGTMVILADGGISNGVMALCGQYHNDPQKLGQVINTGMDLRKKFALGSLLIAGPILVFMLTKNGTSVAMSLLILLTIIPSFFTSLSGNLLETVAKVKQDILPLQRVKVEANLGRLVLLSLFIFVIPYAYIALLISGIPQIYSNWKVRKNADKYVDFDQAPQDEFRNKILKVVYRILPGAAYFSISGTINIYLISIFSKDGSTAIADLGALDRLSMVLTIFSALFVTLITPRYVRLPDERGILFNRFLQILVYLFGLSFFIVGFVWLFDKYLLMLLGNNFKGLEYPLLLNIIGNCIGMMAGNVYTLFTNRAWNLHPLFSIPLSAATIVVGVLLFPIGTLTGVLYLNIFISTVNLVVNSSYLIYKIHSKKR